MTSEIAGIGDCGMTKASWFAAFAAFAVVLWGPGCTTSGENLDSGNGGNVAGTGSGGAVTGGGGTGGGGGIGGSSGSGGGCGPRDLAEFGCPPTYAEALTFACTVPYVTWAESRTCGDYSSTWITTGIWSTTCAYDAQGRLSWAGHCDDVPNRCGSLCSSSVSSSSSDGGGAAPSSCTSSRICLDGGVDAQ